MIDETPHRFTRLQPERNLQLTHEINFGPMKLFSFLLVASAAAFAPTTPHLSRSVVIKSPVMMPKDNPYTFATGTKPNAKSAYRPPRSTGDAQDSEVISTIGIFAFAGELTVLETPLCRAPRNPSPSL